MTLRQPLLLLLWVLWCGCAPEWLLDPGAGRVVRCLPAPESLDFGTVATGNSLTRQMWLSNVSNQKELLLLETDPPFSIVDAPLAIDPQTTLAIGVAFEPPDGREWVGEVRWHVSNCPVVRARLVGRGRDAPLRFSTRFLEFGPVAPGAQETRSLLVFSQSSLPVPFEVLGDYQAPAPVPGSALSSFSAPVRGAEVQPMQVFELPLTFQAGDAGVHQAELTFRAASLDFSEVVRLRGVSGRPELEFEPMAFTLPHLPLGVATDLQVNFRNVGQGPGQVRTAQLSTELGTSMTSASLFNASGAIVLRLTPMSPGAHRWVLELSTDDPLQPRVQIPIEGNARSIATCMGGLVLPADVQTSGPYPRVVALAFENVSRASCLVHELQFTRFSTSRLSDRQLLVPAGTTARLELTLFEPRNDTLSYEVHGEAPRSLDVNAAP